MKTLTLILVLAALPTLGQSAVAPALPYTLTDDNSTGFVLKQDVSNRAAGPGAANNLTTGSYNLLIGNDSGGEATTQSYLFCIGDRSCSGTVKSCEIDVKSVAWPKPILTRDDENQMLATLGAGMRLAAIQNKHCGYDKRRTATLLKLAALIPWKVP